MIDLFRDAKSVFIVQYLIKSQYLHPFTSFLSRQLNIINYINFQSKFLLIEFSFALSFLFGLIVSHVDDQACLSRHIGSTQVSEENLLNVDMKVHKLSHRLLTKETLSLEIHLLVSLVRQALTFSNSRPFPYPEFH